MNFISSAKTDNHDPHDRTIIADAVGNKSSFGGFLVATDRVSGAALERATRLANEEGQKLGPALVGLGLIGDRDLADAYATFLKIPVLRRDMVPEASILTDILNPIFLREYRALPIAVDAKSVSVAMADPLDTETIDAFRFALNRHVLCIAASFSDVEECLGRLYTEKVDEEPAFNDASDEVLADDIDRLRDSASEAPVIRLVNQIITRGVESRASDIHFEPTADGLEVRLRIDGVLRNVESPPLPLRAAIISRLKIMATLNIAERRVAQDGRMTLAIRGRDIDFRISTMPVIYGESVVLRILDRAGLTLELPALGFAGTALESWNQAIRRNKGIVLITGPTGSGKTTTLYASVLAIADRGRKILTIEDPVEYRLPQINQTQVRTAVDMTFSNALRWSLRHDLDVMMIGEIRDVETARIAVQAALTGHLILSTLHTNDAASALTRLVDLGIETYLLTSTINAVAAQRLVRLLCQHCKRPTPVLPEFASTLGLNSATIYTAEGCRHCGGTGYLGRTALVEVLEVTGEIKRMVLRRCDADEIRVAGEAAGMRSIRKHGLELVDRGITTLEEVLRVVDYA